MRKQSFLELKKDKGIHTFPFNSKFPLNKLFFLLAV